MDTFFGSDREFDAEEGKPVARYDNGVFDIAVPPGIRPFFERRHHPGGTSARAVEKPVPFRRN